MSPKTLTSSRMAAEADLLVGAGAEDVGRVVEGRADEHRRRDRPDEGHEVEDAADEGGLPKRGHGSSFVCGVSLGVSG